MQPNFPIELKSLIAKYLALEQDYQITINSVNLINPTFNHIWNQMYITLHYQSGDTGGAIRFYPQYYNYNISINLNAINKVKSGIAGIIDFTFYYKT